MTNYTDLYSYYPVQLRKVFDRLNICFMCFGPTHVCLPTHCQLHTHTHTTFAEVCGNGKIHPLRYRE